MEYLKYNYAYNYLVSDKLNTIFRKYFAYIQSARLKNFWVEHWSKVSQMVLIFRNIVVNFIDMNNVIYVIYSGGKIRVI